MKFQLIAYRTAAIEHPQALRAEHPFVAVGHGEVAVVGLDIEGQGAQLLDGIDAEQHAMLAAAATEARQIQAQAAGELHGADRQQACSRGEGG